MNIQGVQKLTLLDYPGKLACTIFTAPCNLRCPFCHNSSLITGTNESLHWEELKSFLLSRQGVLDGVCITGGEPALHRALPTYLSEIKAMGFSIKLDTNGTKPDVIRQLVRSQLVDYIALDVKNSKSRYSETAGVSEINLAPIVETIEFLLTDSVEYEFRTTVVKEFHSREDLLDLAHWIQGARRYFLQTFLPSQEVLQPGLNPYSKEEMEQFLKLIKPLVPNAELRGS